MDDNTSDIAAAASPPEVLIELDDIKCGNIFLHEPSRMLKFLCLFCEISYDNINYYCEHLSKHINGADAEQDVELEVAQKFETDNSKIKQEPDTNKQDHSCMENKQNHSRQTEIEKLSNDYADDDLKKHIAEELDEDEEESRQFLFEHDYMGLNDEPNSDSDQIQSFSEDEMEEQEIDEQTALECEDFEALIGNAKILKPAKPTTPEPIAATSSATPSATPYINEPKQRTRTLKIVTAKNHIEELYEKLKNSMRKENHSHQNKKEMDENYVSSQIVGETLITALPEGEDADTLEPKYRGRDEVACPACHKIFRNYASLAIHSRMHYMDSKNTIKMAHRCADCNQLFNKIKDLQTHIQAVHYADGICCRLCNKKLRSAAFLEKHMKRMHMEQPFRCRLCGRSDFDDVDKFEEHTKTHGDEEIYKCYICQRVYSFENNLRQHVLRHVDCAPPETCDICGKQTLRLSQHMRIHQRPKRIVQCAICNKIFSFNSALSRHIKVMHKLSRNLTQNPKKLTRKNSVVSGPKRRRHNLHQALLKSNSTTKTSTTFSAVTSSSDEEYSDFKIPKLGKRKSETKKNDSAKKKVIVELIEDDMNRRSSLADSNADANVDEHMDITVARYETIAAVQSITSSPRNKK